MTKTYGRPGRPSHDKTRTTITLARPIKAALLATQRNISTFVEALAVQDERVAAYLAQQGVCKVLQCEEPITLEESVYCAISSENGLCPGWFCIRHYGEVHDDGAIPR